jgi:ATP-dependent DNA helicase RecQ
VTPNEALKRYFGYDEFREGQAEIIAALTHGKDVMGVMPTGAGKSLCYQIPALLLPGVTLVISPLISLMRDQVQALVANGIPAAFINSSLTDNQFERVIANAKAGQYKIIYAAPERLFAPSMLRLVEALRISLVAVDEAHCISQWGQDFRPSYLDIPKFVEALSARPALAAFTATATPRVREDILSTLRLASPLKIVTGFDRPNLYFEVKQPKDKYAALTEYLKANDGNGIVYCSTRKEVESVTEKLRAEGFSAARYHAGLSDVERSRSQDDFLYDRVRVIVATNAFGMGIDKSNVRFVIHYNMPQNVESYYQEAGRAGRDGLPSDCVLLYARKDIVTALFLIHKSENRDAIYRNRQLLNQMEKYCETSGCLRSFMLNYFGEETESGCGNCGNCNGSVDETDVTVDAQKALSCILRLNKLGAQLALPHVANILIGKSEDFTELSTFGIMKDAPRQYINSLIIRLKALGYIGEAANLFTTPKASEVLFNGVHVTIRGNRPETSAKEKSEKRVKPEPDVPKYALSDALLTALKGLRLEISREENIPAFIVFSDATLVDMCRKHPRTEEEMLSVSGVGQVKFARYGERFLNILRNEEPTAEPQEKLPALTLQLFTEKVCVDETPIQISRVADNLNAVLIQYGKPKTSGIALNKLLIEAGLLEVANGVKLPTEKGAELGITTIERESNHGNFTQCLFGADAQRMCVKLVYG